MAIYQGEQIITQGAQGKGAYQSAIEGGYIGTEEEFNTALANMDSTHVGNKLLHKQSSNCTQTGTNSNAEGSFTKASGNNSHAEGSFSVASNYHAHAEGLESEATGMSAHAEGGNSLASGENSHAEGDSTIASGNNSHAQNRGTIANGEAQTALGVYNVAQGTINTKLDTDYAFIIGNGTSDGARSNALSLTWEGTLDVKKDVTIDSRSLTEHLDSTRLHRQASSGCTQGEDYANAEGYSTTASGATSHAEGYTNTSSGSASHAEGMLTTASGAAAHSEGNGSVASGANAHAEGSASTAEGANSHAEGFSTIASGDYSHAEGMGTTASTESAHAEGSGNNASGNSSHVEGNSNTASGMASHAEGGNTQASGIASHSEGFGSIASSNYSHAEGNTTYSGYYSHAEGDRTLACSGTFYEITGFNDISKNLYLNNATGLSIGSTIIVKINNSSSIVTTISAISGLIITLSTTKTINGNWRYVILPLSDGPTHSEGFQCISSGKYSHAEGTNTLATGMASHSEGGNTEAKGMYAHVEGSGSVAAEFTSHAEGFLTSANGQASHAQNQGTITNGESQTALGAYNIAQGTIDSRANTDYALIVGNGTSDAARSNALSLTWEGTLDVKKGITVNGVDRVLKGTATLATATWVGSSAPYTYTLTVAGMLSTDTPHLDRVTGTDATAAALINTAWALIAGYAIKPQTSANTITFYASAKPTVAIPIMYEAVR